MISVSSLRLCVIVLCVFLVASVLSVGYIIYQVIYFCFLITTLSNRENIWFCDDFWFLILIQIQIFIQIWNFETNLKSRDKFEIFMKDNREECGKLDHKRAIVWLLLPHIQITWNCLLIRVGGSFQFIGCGNFQVIVTFEYGANFEKYSKYDVNNNLNWLCCVVIPA